MQLNLTNGQSYGKLVGVLIHKMMGMSLCFGTKMPKMGTLPAGDIETVANWICAGAQNN